MSDFNVYTIGLCYASVCTALADDEATRRLNLSQPTGVGPWAIADESFASGEPNGVACDMLPNRRHLLFAC